MRDRITEELDKFVKNPEAMGGIFGGVVGFGSTVANGLFGTLIVLVLSLYFLAALPAMKKWGYRLAPRSRRARVEALSEEITRSVGNYVIGQAVVALLNATFAFIVMSIIGVPFAVLLAFVVALLAFIPLVGGMIAGVVVILITLTAGLAVGPRLRHLLLRLPAVRGLLHLTRASCRRPSRCRRCRRDLSDRRRQPARRPGRAHRHPDGGRHPAAGQGDLHRPPGQALAQASSSGDISSAGTGPAPPASGGRGHGPVPIPAASPAAPEPSARDVVNDLVEYPRGMFLPHPQVLGAVHPHHPGLRHQAEAVPRRRPAGGSRRAPAPGRSAACRTPPTAAGDRRWPGAAAATAALRPPPADATGSTAPYMRASSVPKDQPTSQRLGSPRSTANRTAASTSYRSPMPSSNVPSLVPRGDDVPRVLKRSTATPASAGSRYEALR